MIVLISLTKIQIPGHSTLFFQGCIEVAAMDVLDGEGFFENNFEFVETEAHND
jgi:hypothetical protein